ncbi:MAG: helix-turn-helix transcriptional regulator [Candidatus Brevundimonas colombiensis]|uniref:Helix-turn-helix transcriptional regulator n=1 Tax=Candidatus Brevundimonas colombiensis TaxID=3121376 RepID=A0AAJ5X1W9_9CAUL|nr:helix-turn-helix transcriptional regulator [Brevundimonas sp.]WEK41116.1 MAG: helix-turn-helix transcriptional regulator [Brevundimonas sp.]
MTMQRDDLDPIDIHVGAQLKALRATARLTQAELAGALGVTFQQVQKYEKGVNRMAASTLARAAAALNCSITDFYPKTEVDEAQPGRQDVLGELAGLYDKMGKRQRDALLTTARALADVRR